MTVTRADVVAEARTWIGTKFVHQQSMKGAGVDCIGLARGVYRELGLRSTDEKIALARQYAGYSSQPDGVSLKAFCDEFMTPIARSEVQPGDVLLIRFGPHPQHSAILGDYLHGGLSMIHTLGPGGPGKVVEHRLDETWRKRIVAAYSIPGVE